MDDRPVAMALKIPIDVVLLLVRTPNEVATLLETSFRGQQLQDLLLLQATQQECDVSCLQKVYTSLLEDPNLSALVPPAMHATAAVTRASDLTQSKLNDCFSALSALSLQLQHHAQTSAAVAVELRRQPACQELAIERELVADLQREASQRAQSIARLRGHCALPSFSQALDAFKAAAADKLHALTATAPPQWHQHQQPLQPLQERGVMVTATAPPPPPPVAAATLPDLQGQVQALARGLHAVASKVDHHFRVQHRHRHRSIEVDYTTTKSDQGHGTMPDVVNNSHQKQEEPRQLPSPMQLPGSSLPPRIQEISPGGTTHPEVLQSYHHHHDGTRGRGVDRNGEQQPQQQVVVEEDGVTFAPRAPEEEEEEEERNEDAGTRRPHSNNIGAPAISAGNGGPLTQNRALRGDAAPSTSTEDGKDAAAASQPLSGSVAEDHNASPVMATAPEFCFAIDPGSFVGPTPGSFVHAAAAAVHTSHHQQRGQQPPSHLRVLQNFQEQQEQQELEKKDDDFVEEKREDEDGSGCDEKENMDATQTQSQGRSGGSADQQHPLAEDAVVAALEKKPRSHLSEKEEDNRIDNGGDDDQRTSSQQQSEDKEEKCEGRNRRDVVVVVVPPGSTSGTSSDSQPHPTPAVVAEKEQATHLPPPPPPPAATPAVAKDPLQVPQRFNNYPNHHHRGGGPSAPAAALEQVSQRDSSSPGSGKKVDLKNNTHSALQRKRGEGRRAAGNDVKDNVKSDNEITPTDAAVNHRGGSKDVDREGGGNPANDDGNGQKRKFSTLTSGENPVVAVAAAITPLENESEQQHSRDDSGGNVGSPNDLHMNHPNNNTGRSGSEKRQKRTRFASEAEAAIEMITAPPPQQPQPQSDDVADEILVEEEELELTEPLTIEDDGPIDDDDPTPAHEIAAAVLSSLEKEDGSQLHPQPQQPSLASGPSSGDGGGLALWETPRAAAIPHHGYGYGFFSGTRAGALPQPPLQTLLPPPQPHLFGSSLDSVFGGAGGGGGGATATASMKTPYSGRIQRNIEGMNVPSTGMGKSSSSSSSLSEEQRKRKKLLVLHQSGNSQQEVPFQPAQEDERSPFMNCVAGAAKGATLRYIGGSDGYFTLPSGQFGGDTPGGGHVPLLTAETGASYRRGYFSAVREQKEENDDGGGDELMPPPPPLPSTQPSQ